MIGQRVLSGITASRPVLEEKLLALGDLRVIFFLGIGHRRGFLRAVAFSILPPKPQGTVGQTSINVTKQLVYRACVHHKIFKKAANLPSHLLLHTFNYFFDSILKRNLRNKAGIFLQRCHIHTGTG